MQQVKITRVNLRHTGVCSCGVSGVLDIALVLVKVVVMTEALIVYVGAGAGLTRLLVGRQ